MMTINRNMLNFQMGSAAGTEQNHRFCILRLARHRNVVNGLGNVIYLLLISSSITVMPPPPWPPSPWSPGMYLGTVIAMPLAGVLAEHISWESIFYVFGGFFSRPTPIGGP